jgi:hypothetical protein
MAEEVPFVLAVTPEAAEPLLADWRWLVTKELTPLFVTTLGDWIFGAPDGSIWTLSLLEGDLRMLARTGTDYNRLKRDPKWLEDELAAGWAIIADGNGLVPGRDQCVGWKLHPVLGGAFDKTNLEIFSMPVYQSLMGQLFRQLAGRPATP